MHHLILWCGFLGAWLLVAGPLNQSTRELEEEEIEREDMMEVAKGIEAPAPVSKWWWLFPPAYFFLRQRRSDEFKRRVVAKMPDAQVEALVSYKDKATAWFFVAGGAFLIAVKETWELHEGYHWSAGVFWGLVAVMILLCALNTAAGVRRRRDPRGALLHR
jgi:hypothetical protein